MNTNNPPLILTSLIALFFYITLVQTAKLDNEIEFKALCGIYQQLKYINSQTEAGLFGIKRPLLEAERKSVKNAFQLLTGEEIEGKQGTGEKNTTPDAELRRPLHPTTPFGVYSVRVAESRVKNILGQIGETGKLYADLRRFADEGKSALDDAKAQIPKAICGDSGGAELDACKAGAFASTLSAGSTTHAGMSLANDIAYLCRTTSSNNECVATVSQPDADDDNAAAARYAEIIKACPSGPTQVTHKSLAGALQKFFSLVGMQTVASASATVPIGAVLGKFQTSSSNNCGSSTTTYVCINYGKRTNAKKEEIPWVGKVREVLKEWEVVEQKKRDIDRLLRQAHELEAEAWREFDKAELAQNVSFPLDPKDKVVRPSSNSKSEAGPDTPPTLSTPSASVNFARVSYLAGLGFVGRILAIQPRSF